MLLCAADTFRAAAIEQLEVWAGRSGVEMIKTRHGGDPAAVLYDAASAAKARGIDELIVDTAGRLHTKTGLMDELDKMRRTAAKLVPGAPHEVLLVMDATTGQNGLQQARLFTQAAGVTGILLTKLDGTAKGGIAVAIAREMNLPVRFVGRGRADGGFVGVFGGGVCGFVAGVGMGALDQDRQWMQRALELARKGIGVTSPNPAVGCVLLDRGGQLAGEGWHDYDRKDHAEIAALNDAKKSGKDIGGGTAYVTLEPCNHTGRTGPCTEALIAAGLKRVVAATIDPNPAVAGHGMDRLRAAGLEIAVGVCEAEARRLNEGFARWSQHKRPLVLMKVAMSLDGRIAPPPGRHTPGQPYWITGETARESVQTLRWQADAAMVGVDTVLADDPLLTDRSGRRRRRPLLRLVLDSALRMPLDSKLVATAHNDVIVFTVSSDEERIEELRRRGVRVEVMPAEAGVPGDRSSSQGWEAGRVPLGKVLDKLGEEGILTLLTETGTRLNTALLAGGMVDRIHLFVSPQIMGSDAVPAFKGITDFIRMAEVEVERYGNDLGLCSLLRDPWKDWG